MALNFDEYQEPNGGYYSIGKEDDFYWECKDRLVWYSLSVYKDDKVYKYGYTSAGKYSLADDLESLPSDCVAELMGVWTGNYYTSLFLLDINIAINKIRGLR